MTSVDKRCAFRPLTHTLDSRIESQRRNVLHGCDQHVLCLSPCRGYTGHKQPAIAERLEQYIKAAEQHPAVAASMYHPKSLDYRTELLKSYARYADGSANSMMARDAK